MVPNPMNKWMLWGKTTTPIFGGTPLTVFSVCRQKKLVLGIADPFGVRYRHWKMRREFSCKIWDLLNFFLIQSGLVILKTFERLNQCLKRWWFQPI